MRICFTSDLHGAPALFQQLDALLERESPDLLILGGDMHPDGADPNPVAAQVRYVREDFLPRAARWCDRRPGLVVAGILGNHDWQPSADALHDAERATGGRLVLLDPHAPREIHGVTFLGYSPSPPTPWWIKDFERPDTRQDGPCEFGGKRWDAERGRLVEIDLREHFAPARSIEADLEQIATPSGPFVLVSHAPPHDTKLDWLPTVGYPIGSRAIRRFIESRGPTLSLHGHIHESPQVTRSYLDEVGATLCVNPGQSHETLHAVLFDSDDPRRTLRHTVFS